MSNIMHIIKILLVDDDADDRESFRQAEGRRSLSSRRRTGGKISTKHTWEAPHAYWRSTLMNLIHEKYAITF